MNIKLFNIWVNWKQLHIFESIYCSLIIFLHHFIFKKLKILNWLERWYGIIQLYNIAKLIWIILIIFICKFHCNVFVWSHAMHEKYFSIFGKKCKGLYTISVTFFRTSKNYWWIFWNVWKVTGHHYSLIRKRTDNYFFVNRVYLSNFKFLF